RAIRDVPRAAAARKREADCENSSSRHDALSEQLPGHQEAAYFSDLRWPQTGARTPSCGPAVHRNHATARRARIQWPSATVRDLLWWRVPPWGLAVMAMT